MRRRLGPRPGQGQAPPPSAAAGRSLSCASEGSAAAAGSNLAAACPCPPSALFALLQPLCAVVAAAGHPPRAAGCRCRCCHLRGCRCAGPKAVRWAAAGTCGGHTA